MSKEALKKIEEITLPILQYLKEEYNPHTTIIINQNYIKVVSDEINIPLNLF